MFVVITACVAFFLYAVSGEKVKSDGAKALESKTLVDNTKKLAKAKNDLSTVEKQGNKSKDIQDGSRQSSEPMQKKNHDLNDSNDEQHDEHNNEQIKYDGDYRNDLLTRFMEEDFEQFMEEKNLQVNQVQCQDAVCNIDFYSKVPLNNDEDLRNDLILDIAIKLQMMGLLSEDNNVSDSGNNFENIAFKIRMDEGN